MSSSEPKDSKRVSQVASLNRLLAANHISSDTRLNSSSYSSQDSSKKLLDQIFQSMTNVSSSDKKNKCKKKKKTRNNQSTIKCPQKISSVKGQPSLIKSESCQPEDIKLDQLDKTRMIINQLQSSSAANQLTSKMSKQ